MGIEYWLINKENQEKFELSKGDWWHLNDGVNLKTILLAIDNFNVPDKLAYADWIYEEIKRNIGLQNLQLISDETEEAYGMWARYNQVGTRFTSNY